VSVVLLLVVSLYPTLFASLPSVLYLSHILCVAGVIGLSLMILFKSYNRTNSSIHLRGCMLIHGTEPTWGPSTN